jgi:hypothetical protein
VHEVPDRFDDDVNGLPGHKISRFRISRHDASTSFGAALSAGKMHP